MNWKLIFSLSLFGLFMALATVFFIPFAVEPFCWLVIFVICAYIIARRANSNYFWHGFMISIFNCVWILAAHYAWFDTYIAHHPEMNDDPSVTNVEQKNMMLLMGPIFGIASGLVLGLFCYLASLLVKKAKPQV